MDNYIPMSNVDVITYPRRNPDTCLANLDISPLYTIPDKHTDYYHEHRIAP